MSGKANTLENQLLDAVLRNQTYTSPATVYCALFTATPSDAGGGTEVSGGTYARIAITFGAPSGGSANNSVAITFAVATADWGNIVAFAVMDHLTLTTEATYKYWGPLTTAKPVDTDDQLVWGIGDLVITEE